jgi:hypothetical protein
MLSKRRTLLETYGAGGVYRFEDPFFTFGVMLGTSTEMVLHLQLVLKIWETIFNCKDRVFTGKTSSGVESHYGLDQGIVNFIKHGAAPELVNYPLHG